MPIYFWVLFAGVALIGVCRLAFLIEAISTTYKMLKGRHPSVRKGGLWGTVSILSEATLQTIHYQSALDHEHAAHLHEPIPDGISHPAHQPHDSLN
jgi:hypothetical protein